MPSAYTQQIQEGKLSFREFALLCARAMGATIMMRDEPLGKEIPEFEPSDYHKKALEEAEIELQKLQNMTDDEWIDKTFREHQQEAERIKAWNTQNDAIAANYNAMLTEVNAWQPPTNEHTGLKDFMVKQITESIQWDCHHYDIPEMKNWAAYKSEYLQKAERDIAYHTKEHAKEVERTNSRNKWIVDLKKSLK